MIKKYCGTESYKLFHGNMLEMADAIENKNCVDAIVCDPPYELNFMGKGWDNAGISFNPDTWKKCYDHPTVKPTSLMQYLVRLVTPKGGTVLDPFMGSGSTGKAVMYENNERNAGYKFIGIELTDEYLPIAQARIQAAKEAK